MPMSLIEARRELAALKARHESDARVSAQNRRLARIYAIAAEHAPLELVLARAALLVREAKALVARGKPAQPKPAYRPLRPPARW